MSIKVDKKDAISYCKNDNIIQLKSVIVDRDRNIRSIVAEDSMTSYENDKVHQAADKAFRALLQSKKTFIELIQYFLHANWTDNIDEQSLTIVDRSFVLHDFSSKEADIVYSCKLNGRSFVFYLLLEMQSRVDQQMPWRLLQYMNEIWRMYMKNQGEYLRKRIQFKMPTIIPIVLYIGKYKWTAVKEFKDYLANSDIDPVSCVNFRYHLIDMTRWNENDIESIPGILPLVYHLINTKDVLQTLIEMRSSVQKLEEREIGLLNVFISKVLNLHISSQDFEEIKKKNDNKGEIDVFEDVTRLARNLKEDGRKEGKRESAELLLQNGLSANDVSNYLKLPLNEVLSLVDKQKPDI